MIIIDLKPINDSRKSFYGKAKLVVSNGCIDLLSYDTFIASYNSDTGVLIYNEYFDYSQTTLRHLKEFIFQCLGKVVGIKELRDNKERVITR